MPTASSPKEPLRPYFADRGIEIYHGDCLEILPRLAGRKFSLVLSDPPYRFKSLGGGGFRAQIYNTRKLREMSHFDPHAFVAAVELLQQPVNIVACCSRDLVATYGRIAGERGWRYDVHVWHKPNAIPFTHNTFKSDIEYLALLYAAKRPFRNGLPQTQYSKVFTHNVLRNKVHITQKPLELMRRYATILCPADGALLDPYVGSGTTLVAAVELGLQAVGIEKDKKQCRIAAERVAAAERFVP